MAVIHDVVSIGDLTSRRRDRWEFFGCCCMENVSRCPNLSERESGRTEGTVPLFVVLNLFIGCNYREARRGTNNCVCPPISPLSVWAETLREMF